MVMVCNFSHLARTTSPAPRESPSPRGQKLPPGLASPTARGAPPGWLGAEHQTRHARLALHYQRRQVRRLEAHGPAAIAATRLPGDHEMAAFVAVGTGHAHSSPARTPPKSITTRPARPAPRACVMLKKRRIRQMAGSQAPWDCGPGRQHRGGMIFRRLCQENGMVSRLDYNRNTETLNPSVIFLANTSARSCSFRAGPG